MTGLHVWPTQKLQTEGERVNVALRAKPIWLTHAGNDTVDRQTGEPVVDGLVHPPGISPCATPWRLPLTPDKCWILLFGNIDIKTGVRRSHDVTRTRVQQDVCGVQSAYSNQTHSVPADTETGSAQRARPYVFSSFCFGTLWLTFCEHERRQRWNFCPGIPRRIYSPPGECDAPHWLSSGGRSGAIGLLSMHHSPYGRNKNNDWLCGERLTFATQNTEHLPQLQGHIIRFNRGNILHLCQSSWSILHSAHGCRQGHPAEQ